MTYNASILDNITGISDAITQINTASDQFFLSTLLLIIFLIGMYSFRQHDTKTLLLGNSAFITFIAALLWGSGIASFAIMTLPVLLLVISIMIFMFT